MKRRGLRCWLGLHRWVRHPESSSWYPVWHCTRCDRAPAPCNNCGSQHDPTAFMTICSVTR